MSTTSSSSSAPQTLSITIISDNICPFCYLGKKKLESALSRLGSDVAVAVEWRPYELDPTLPVQGMDKQERYAKKFPPERLPQILSQLKTNGQHWGIKFSFNGKVGNTVNSHRLIELSKSNEGGNSKHTDKLINLMFTSYFEHEGDLTSLDHLSQLGVDAGLPVTKQRLLEFLRGDELRKEVVEAVRDARNAEITGVPHFIIDNKYSISGAQEPDVFMHVFNKVLGKGACAGNNPCSGSANANHNHAGQPIMCPTQHDNAPPPPPINKDMICN